MRETNGSEGTVGSELSALRSVKRGCVQGSILGILQHNISLDSLDDGLEDMSSKHVDNLSLVKQLDTGDVDLSGRVWAEGGESAFKTIKERAEAANMKVNSNKTSLLC